MTIPQMHPFARDLLSSERAAGIRVVSFVEELLVVVWSKWERYGNVILVRS